MAESVLLVLNHVGLHHLTGYFPFASSLFLEGIFVLHLLSSFQFPFFKLPLQSLLSHPLDLPTSLQVNSTILGSQAFL